ncbi:hypothetical protein QJS10_CPB11g01655 [Acorus calamus]|uniref:Uncharacterized protein n=1 Tax=Acorus calamus TaxID=4465 RepID=A0AAV9DRC2_ACOCL|nr:hypothetical protein QJS10_CPB11g01655 [Acorus calamus]
MEGEDFTQPPPTGNNGIIGTIDFHGSGGSTDLTDHVHLLPCSVKHDGPQPVSDYFKPRNTGELVDEMVVKEAFFRGRKLQGTAVSIPDGYCGFVLGKKLKGPKSGDSLDSIDWEARARFGNLTYYNHDDVPSNEDALPRCFHWFAVVDAENAKASQKSMME